MNVHGKTMVWAAACLGLMVSLTSQAQPSPQVVREIDGLIQGLANSSCEFNRNGKWYPPAKARDHLQNKYNYLRKRDLVDSAEQFIERAASRSSMSGAAYRVRCPGAAEQAASTWFAELLVRQRRSSVPPR